MTPGLVRVLLSTYNSARFIRPMLDSVLAQTHAPLELWVRDDGSKDETPAILADYARRFPDRLRVDAAPNVGMVRSYFTLIRDAGHDAEFTAFADHDDVWHADKIERAVAMLRAHGGAGPLMYTGRLHIVEPNGRDHVVRLAFAGNNEQPYKSVGRWLVDLGELKLTEASWPTIKDWARRNPARVQELLWANPRMVWFREEALPDARVGPRGAQGAPLTPNRSIAVDPAAVPLGTPVWLDTTEPLSNTPLRRVVLAQDTGSAITGAVRADYFWGWGDQAEQQAGRMKQPLRMWVLWPRS